MKDNQRAGRFYFQSGQDGILLIHGFTGTPWALRDLGWALASSGKTVLAPLLPGHGDSLSALIGTKWTDWVEAARTSYRILENRCSTVCLIGLSAGGTIALNLASEIKVNKLVCLSTPMDSNGFKKLKFEKMIHYWPKWHALYKRYPKEEGYRIYPVQAVREFYRLLDNTKKKLPDVHCPTFLMHSKEDRTVPFEQMGMIASSIGSKIVETDALDLRAHTITVGKSKEEVQKKIIQFISDDKNVIKTKDLCV